MSHRLAKCASPRPLHLWLMCLIDPVHPLLEGLLLVLLELLWRHVPVPGGPLGHRQMPPTYSNSTTAPPPAIRRATPGRVVRERSF